jgi:hypothetical protein
MGATLRDHSPYAGGTVRLKDTAAELGGQQAEVVDWYANAAGRTWRQALEAGDPKADGYNIRHGLGGLPDDDDVLLARVDGITQLIHRTEIDGEAADQGIPGREPQPVSESEVGQPCAACGSDLAAGDMVAPVVLGPGGDPAARSNARSGQPFNAAVIEIHWACATGDEQYERTGA